MEGTGYTIEAVPGIISGPDIGFEPDWGINWYSPPRDPLEDFFHDIVWIIENEQDDSDSERYEHRNLH